MAQKHGVVRTDKMYGTDNREGIASVRFQNEGVNAEIDNGNVVRIDGLEAGSREIYVGVAPSASDDLKDILLIASPEVMYDERKRNLDEFVNEAGVAARGYYLHKNSIFSVTKDALVGLEAPAKGNFVELTAGTKLNVVESATGTLVGEIIDVEIVGRYTYYVIQVA